MAVPKKKTSKRRTGMRSSANLKATPITLTKCPKCGEPKKAHIVCGFCGYYKGQKVLDVQTKLDKKLKSDKNKGTSVQEKKNSN